MRINRLRQRGLTGGRAGLRGRLRAVLRLLWARDEKRPGGGLAAGVTPVREESDVFAVRRPVGLAIDGRVRGQAGQPRAICADDVDVGVAVNRVLKCDPGAVR